MIAIDPERVLADLRALNAFGPYKTGVHRPSLSPAHMGALHWLAGRAAEAGLEPTLDGIGNVIARTRAAGPKLLVGSHLESQNYAGWLDGPLGVIYGLEAARALVADPRCREVGVDLAVWCDEEGHFGQFLGSRSFIGDVADAEIEAARDRTSGTPLREALAAAGLAGRPRLRCEPGRHLGYIEAHIEQGDTLDSSGDKLAVVTSIVGIHQFRITFEGAQNHAGTTRMAIRRDAGLACARLACAIDEAFPKVAAERTVWTTGRITLEPGDPSVIPGRAQMLFQFRDADPAVLARLEAHLEEMVTAANAAGPCRVSLECLRRSKPAVMDSRLQAALETAAERHAPGRHRRLPSGAGHDAQILSRVMPAAMLFVPSIGGISHHWTENTSDADIVTGARTFADAVGAVLLGDR